MKDVLDRSGYQLLETVDVWCRDGYAGIAYNDGDDAEVRLARIVEEAKDVSVFSLELATAAKDWQSRYHLSSERANLLRPFGIAEGMRVLEIGAGCGAVTRYLGESGACVLALEGSLRRASITRSRTRDLPNVTVLAERFQDLSIEDRFDVVTLVGVLEYSGIFSSDAEPALALLRRARELLAPGGRLILAIENQMGLKYFAGAPEDHTGNPMTGIEDQYSAATARTWGKDELQALLSRAGFASSEFMAPLPDYKMPASILTQKGMEDGTFDAASLVRQAVKRDLQLPQATTFNLQRAWSVVMSNGLGMEMANSFLIEASLDASHHAARAEVLAYHYSTQRVRRFVREKRFIREADGVQVRCRHLGGPMPEDGSVRAVDHLMPETEPYVRGTSLASAMQEVLTKPGWTMDGLASAFAVYLAALREVVEREGQKFGHPEMNTSLPPDYLDATPANLLVTAGAVVHYIDREWVAADVRLGWLLVRSLLFTYGGTIVAPASDTVPRSLKQVILGVLARLGIECNEQAFAECIQRENQFQQAVTGKSQEEAILGMLEPPLAPVPASSGPFNVQDAFATLEHAANLNAQHGMNLYALLEATHRAAVEAARGPGAEVLRQQATMEELSAGMLAVHERVVTSHDSLVEMTSAYLEAATARDMDSQRVLAASVEAGQARADDAMAVLTSIERRLRELGDRQDQVMARLRRPWWKFW